LIADYFKLFSILYDNLALGTAIQQSDQLTTVYKDANTTVQVTVDRPAPLSWINGVNWIQSLKASAVNIKGEIEIASRPPANTQPLAFPFPEKATETAFLKKFDDNSPMAVLFQRIQSFGRE